MWVKIYNVIKNKICIYWSGKLSVHKLQHQKVTVMKLTSKCKIKSLKFLISYVCTLDKILWCSINTIIIFNRNWPNLLFSLCPNSQKWLKLTTRSTWSCCFGRHLEMPVILSKAMEVIRRSEYLVKFIHFM
jgi:hypothetical protein